MDYVVAWDVDTGQLVLTRPTPTTNSLGLRGTSETERSKKSECSERELTPTMKGSSDFKLERESTGTRILQSTPTSDPREDRLRSTRWMKEADNVINEALKRLAEPIPAPGESKDKYNTRRQAYERVQVTSGEVATAEVEQ